MLKFGQQWGVSTHSHLKVADEPEVDATFGYKVSTHSHLKVAESLPVINLPHDGGFNTQPPEGG